MRNYKQLGDVEQAFRSLKGLDLLVRPIHHHLHDRVRAHVFVCLLAYYVQWHLKRAWRPLLFADEDLAAQRAERDPAASAKPSAELRAKKASRVTPDGHELQSFRTLLTSLGTQCRNGCEFGEGKTIVRDIKLTEPTAQQVEAFSLLDHAWCQS